MNICSHHWIISPNNIIDGDSRIIHERCKLCNGERDLVENRFTDERHYTDIVYREKVDNMGNISGRQLYYEKNKEEIIKDYEELGNASACKKWDIPSSTFTGLKKKWGLKILEHRGKSSFIDKHNGDMVPISVIDEMFDYKTSEGMHAFWKGYVLGRSHK